MKRNTALRKAMDVLKKDSRASGKDVKILWKFEDGSKNRAVMVGSEQGFLQNSAEMTGNFFGRFSDVSF